jgi:cytochrome c oxidase subunit 2
MVAKAGMRRLGGTVLALAGLFGMAGQAAAQAAAGAATAVATGGAADQAPIVIEPMPWQLNLQPAATPVMQMLHTFNTGLLIVCSAIMLLVLVLLVYCIVRFNARANPVPSKTSHNTLIEVLWTVVPILILIGIAVPSFALLFAQHDPARAIAGYDPVKNPPLTIKATGNQWYWSYDYPDLKKHYDSNILSEADLQKLKPTEPRLLAVDNEMVVPVDTTVRVQVTGADVIHSFAVPSFGIKIDAVPGRLNETWFRVDRPGVYYGQCSELCGQAPPESVNDLHGHAFMPIAVRAVSAEKFAAWAAAAGKDLKAANALLAASYAPQPGAAPGTADDVRVAAAVK